MNPLKWLLNVLNSGSNRTTIVKKNIVWSFLIQGLSITTSLILVPATLKLIDDEKYGLWITIYSIVTWFNMMDIGLGNGFRNKFAHAIALNRQSDAKDYLSTLYTSTSIISSGVILLYLIVSPFLNWGEILNISSNFDENISQIVATAFILFAIQLTVKNITTVLLAIQKTALSNFINFLGNLFALISVYILGAIGLASLYTITLSFMLAPILVWIIATFYISKTTLKEIAQIRFKLNMFNDIMGLGIKFFFIQIAALVMFGTGNFVITRLFGPSEVTPYNIVYRLFSASISLFAIIKAPFWSAFTEAHAMKDLLWMKRSIKKLIIIWSGFSVLVILTLVLSSHIYEIWIGSDIIIPTSLSIQFALFAILMSWTGIFSQFLNGIGVIRIQLIVAVIQCLIVVPLGVFFAKNLNLGSTGVILSINLNLIIASIVLSIQTMKITNGVANGYWYR